MSFEEEKQEVNQELKCTGCGAVLQFKPGTPHLTCTYCGADNVIEGSDEQIEELDYEEFINSKLADEEKIEVSTVKCSACGATTSLQPNVTSDQCPYCASSLVIKDGSTSTILKPKSVLPFVVDKRKATESFRDWIHGLWFAPNKLKERASGGKLDGLYVPYWTYDTNTYTQYTGQRGTYYYVTETYTTTENGESVTKTRQVRRTRWNSCSGQVNDVFDDILVLASTSLPKKYADKLDPWYLKDLKPFNEKFLSGFRSESYQVDVVQGLDTAKQQIQPTIRTTVCRDIGGDEQRVTTMRIAYNDITFKHVLLPIWISSYRYKDKVYNFLINGQTGEVQGERPWSAAKIALAVLALLAVIAVIVILTNK